VAAAAVTLICLSIALAVGNVLVRNQRDRAEIARQQADEANQRAQQNAATTRQVLDHFLVQIGDDELSLIPQFETVRVRMVEEAVRRYRELLRRNPDDESLRSDVAMTLRRCANLYRMVNHFEKAGELYQDSVAIMQDLIENSQNQAYRDRFIDLLRDQADLLLRAKGPVAAEPVYQKATEFARRCREDLPDSVSIRRAEALLQNDYSEVLCKLGQYDRALSLAQESARILSDQADVAPSDLLGRILAVFAWNNLGRTAREAGKLDLAASALRRGVARGRANCEINQHEPNSRFTLAWALVERGLLDSGHGQSENARASLEEAIEILESLTNESPRTASFRRKLAEALTARGEQLAAEGALPAAINDAQRAVELLEKLDQESGGAAIYKPLLMSAYALHGKAELEQGRTNNARAILKKARYVAAVAKTNNPQNLHLAAEADEIESMLRRIER
jgi:tetratricopeptide (TPR) repeat protein